MSQDSLTGIWMWSSLSTIEPLLVSLFPDEKRVITLSSDDYEWSQGSVNQDSETKIAPLMFVIWSED